MKKRWIVVLLTFLLMISCAQAEEKLTVTAQLPVSQGVVEIRSTTIEDEPWLFLPAHADLSALPLVLPAGWTVESAEGGTVDVLSLSEAEEGVYTVELVSSGGDSAWLYIMQSENLRALYLYSDDPVGHGRKWLEDCPEHENETTGRMALVDANGVVDHADTLTQLRGRGNSTWQHLKKPYQFKLETRADLLKTGIAAERNRTWVLLAEVADPTFLHNRISMDLALEMGMSETSRSEHVDLYYDGEYRGLYLLSEKTEVGEGRIEIRDYEDLLKRWNKRVGQKELDALPVAEGVNRYGCTFFYNAGVIADRDVRAGGYMIELESATTMAERCWFFLSNGSRYSFRNPENPNREMAAYASELLEEGYTAIVNGGVHPETGKTIEAYFDLTSFARLVLLVEMTGNMDTFGWSSTFFILPEGETRFRAGPIWDCDLTWRFLRDGSIDNGRGMVPTNNWLKGLYGCESFRSALVQELPLLENAIVNVLLGGEKGQYLQPLDWYVDQISASVRMNQKIWNRPLWDLRLEYATEPQQDYALLRRFATERIAWLKDTLNRWQEGGELALRMTVVYANTETTQLIDAHDPWVSVSVRRLETTQMTEADEENFALWQTDVELECEIEEGMTLTVNGTVIPYEIIEGGISFSLIMEDATYRPVDCYGENIGMIFNAEYYAAHYPEVVEECGDDPEALMEYFYYDGIYLGHQGCAAFSPKEVSKWIVNARLTYEENWEEYYLAYIGGSAGEWMLEMNKRYQPAIHAAEE